MSFVEHTGPARLDRRTKHLVRRLSPDDIAIIDHADLDRVSAEELLDAGIRVVINVSQSQTGRFPNPGPLLLVRGGVRLLDVRGAADGARSRALPERDADRGGAGASRGRALGCATGTAEQGHRGARELRRE